MSIHSRIRAARLAKKLTEQQLADKVGVSRPAVQQWEKEGGTAPRRKIQDVVAAALGMSTGQLLGSEPWPGDGGAVATPPALIGKPATDAATTLVQALEVVAQALQGADELSRIQAKPLIQHLMEHPEQAANITHRLAALLNRSGLPPAQTSDFAAPAPTHHFQKTPNGA